MAPETLTAARTGGAWSYAGIVQSGLTDVRDDEGRPLGERRASSAAKHGVPIVLKTCPYTDERLGKPMNVSALAQLVRHLGDVLDDVRAFRAATTTAVPTWEDVLTAVIDQLAAPALYLLRTPASTTLPARAAVAHKLAEGYFGVVRGLVACVAAGEPRPVATDELLAYAHATRAFMGASEACAGPPHLIRRATEAFVEPSRAGDRPVEDAGRVLASRLLRMQVQLGIAWQAYCLALEQQVLALLRAASSRTTFFARALEDRALALADDRAPIVAPVSALPSDLPDDQRRALAQVLVVPSALVADPAWTVPDVDAVGCAVFASLEARGKVGHALQHYLAARCAIVGALATIEHQIRAALEISAGGEIELHPMVFPHDEAQRWLQTSLGCRITVSTELAPTVSVVPVNKPVINAGMSYARRD